MGLLLRIGSSELYAVPAIHFRHYFAQEVRKICMDPQRRPEAIAVELGPRTAISAEGWLRELGVGAGSQRLPVMLGLVKKNRMIKASLRDKAEQLQRETGKDLSELPAKILRQELGLSESSLTCLSPTDSIIEGIRTAIELDLPVFGVDLDEMADGCYKPVIIQYPLPGQGLPAYIDQNASFVERGRDQEVDNRREIVMAARLKMLLLQYKRVVFTCGMAHWLKIKDLLYDSEIRPAAIPENNDKTAKEFRRVVVHPLMAVQHMDLFPALATAYEKSRHGSSSGSMSIRPSCPDPDKIFHSRLKEAYRKYFKAGGAANHSSASSLDLESTSAFQGYLNNLSLLNYKMTPDLPLIVTAAQETMSGEFVDRLFQEFMNYPWATPEQFPECSVLIPYSGEGPDSDATVLTKDALQKKDDVFIRTVPSNNRIGPVLNVPYEWENLREFKSSMGFDNMIFTWRPWDHLISSMCLRAITKAARGRPTKQAVSFEGSMLEGIDVKTTVRAYSRGDEHLYVRELSKECREHLNPIDNFPAVWIIKGTDDDNAEWNVLMEPCKFMERHAKDKSLLRKIVNERGKHLVSSIAYGIEWHERIGGESADNMKSQRIHGITVFQPISFNNKQFAFWAEKTGYNRCPFCNESSLVDGTSSELSDYYGKHHDVRIGEHHWSTTLILLALPFAKEFLTVVVPTGYVIDKEVYIRAAKAGIRICPVQLNSFSKPEIDRLSLCHLVPATNLEPECSYSRAVEKKIGELQSDNRHLLSQSLLDYGSDY